MIDVWFYQLLNQYLCFEVQASLGWPLCHAKGMGYIVKTGVHLLLQNVTITLYFYQIDFC
jgi:hypothetical protein